MPTDMSKYPDNWQEIRERILRRAGGDENDPRIGACCEWCGLMNYSVGYRFDGEFITYLNEYAEGTEDIPWASYKAARDFADDLNGFSPDSGDKYIVIVLTIAHLDDPDPMNCADDNLAALCQKCHNDYDNPMRKRNAANTRRQAEIENGQMELFSEEV